MAKAAMEGGGEHHEGPGTSDQGVLFVLEMIGMEFFCVFFG